MNICWLYYVAGFRNWQITFLRLIALHSFNHHCGVSTIWSKIVDIFSLKMQLLFPLATGVHRTLSDYCQLSLSEGVEVANLRRFKKNRLFLLQLLALSPCVGLYFTKAVSHGYLCRAPVSDIVVTRQRELQRQRKSLS